ncbi:hypothetical protein JOB18_006446 [Solea senegalensis]|nr:hypothetical protein JOB18_006446 [Solea senegalensis]
METMWVEMDDDLTVPDPNGPDLPQDFLQVWLKETVNQLPVPIYPWCNSNRMEPMGETIQRETKDQLNVLKWPQCNPNGPEFMVKTIKIETKDQLPVPEQPQCNPNGPEFMVETVKRETKDQLTENAEDCDPNIPNFLQALEALLGKTADQLPLPAKECDPNREDTLQAVLEELRRQPANCLPVPQELLCDFHPPPASTVPEEQCIDLLPPPFSAQMCNQPDQEQNYNVSAVMFPHCVQGNLFPVGTVNGEVVYAFPQESYIPAFVPTVPPPNNPPTSRRRKCSTQKNVNEKPYIKKPLNAFMLFRQEQRLKVVAELNVRDSAIVNTELGKRWAHLPMQEKNKYFQEADRLRDLHEQQYPEWSTKENYGRKRKRIRRKIPTPVAI